MKVVPDNRVKLAKPAMAKRQLGLCSLYRR
jgi:hypothetical protein